MTHRVHGGIGTARVRAARSVHGAALAFAAGLAAAAAGAPMAIASTGESRPVAAMTAETVAPVTAPATAAPRPAALRLRVTHTLESGRLIVKLAERVILSAPLAAFAGVDGAPRERDLWLPEGRHALSVQMLDALGRVVAKGIVSGYAGGPEPATLEVSERPGTGSGLTLTWRTP